MKNDYENKSSIESLLDGTIERIRTLIDANTIVGEPVISPSGSVIIPISKVAVGFVVGGGEYSDLSARRVAKHYPMAGGSGGGMSVSPVGFLVETDGKFKYVDIENKSAYQTLLNAVNAVLNKLGGNSSDYEN